MTATERPDRAFRDARDRYVLWQQLDRLREVRRVTQLVQQGRLSLDLALRILDGDDLPECLRDWDN